MAVSALNKKLIRDTARIWTQALAIALVLAAGVATLVLGVGAQRSLFETRDAYYDRYRFAEIFASATRAPSELKDRIAEIDGIAQVETRITKVALLDIEGMSEPATGLVISLPETGTPQLNGLHMRSGRLPDPFRDDEVVINEGFALAHGFVAGSMFHAIMNGRKRALHVVGTALSPEFIYALGPGDMMPDDRRFGIIWMPQRAAAAAYDLDGAFNSVSVRLLKGASQPAVQARLDDLLAPYGGRAAYGREDQQSHAFIDAELNQLRSMSWVLPPIFLGVATFLVNITLSRLIALEREQIGLLKALGYSRFAVTVHYTKLIVLIALVGIGIGWAAGILLGRGLTIMYSEFFHFPFLIFLNTPDVFLISGVAAIAAALGGGMKSVSGVIALPPAVAMSPPAPLRYRRYFSGLSVLAVRVPPMLTMITRHLMRFPLRAAMTTLGIAMSIAVLVGSLFALDSVDFMIDATFFRADRQDATLVFVPEANARALQAARHLPGVMMAEPYRTVSVRLVNGHRVERTILTGKPAGPVTPLAPTAAADLSRVIDLDLNPVILPDTGIALAEKLAQLLDIRRGERLRVEVLDGHRAVFEVPVSAILQQFIGLGAYMQLDQMNTRLRDGDVVSGIHLSTDPNERDALYTEVKNIPAVSAIALLERSLQAFRETMAQNLIIMVTVYTSLALVIAFGVVYNSARISLSERARELASLRVLGFTRGEASTVLLGELAILTLLAVPFGWLLGYGFAWLVTLGLQSELYRVPLIIERQTYAFAALIVVIAATLSALIVRRRIDHLDLIKVLKTRD